MSEPLLLTEKQVSALLGISLSSLQKWRHFRKGPSYLKIGHLVRYRLNDLEAFFEKALVNPGEADRASR